MPVPVITLQEHFNFLKDIYNNNKLNDFDYTLEECQHFIKNYFDDSKNDETQ